MRSRKISQGDYNALGAMMEAILDICEDVVIQSLIIYIDNIVMYTGTHKTLIRDLK